MKDALGHGSNKRGTHSAGVERIGNVRLHPNALNVARRNPGGFTVKPSTGRIPTTGYMVSRPGTTLKVRESDLSGPQGASILADFARQHADAIRGGAMIGGWTDPKGVTHLDLSDRFKDGGKAVSAGKSRNQQAIYDVKRQRVIRTGGTGD